MKQFPLNSNIPSGARLLTLKKLMKFTRLRKLGKLQLSKAPLQAFISSKQLLRERRLSGGADCKLGRVPQGHSVTHAGVGFLEM